ELRRGVHRRAGLVDDELRELEVRKTLHQLAGEAVGLAARGAVADRDQLDRVLPAKRRERLQRLFPLPLRLVRINRAGRDELARRVDDRDLDAGAQPRVEAHDGARARGRGEQEILEVVAEDSDRVLLGFLAGAVEEVEREMHVDLAAPREAACGLEPRAGRPAAKRKARMLRDARLRARVPGLGVGARLEVELEDLLAARAKEREQPVRRDLRDRLRVIEIVGVLRPFGLLAFDDARADQTLVPKPFAELPDQPGVLAPALDEDRTRAFERGL